MCSVAQRLHANSYHNARNLNNRGPALFVTVAYGLPIAGVAEAARMNVHQSSLISNDPNTTVLKSVCRSYHGGCGVLLHVRDGVLLKVEGDRKSVV